MTVTIGEFCLEDFSDFVTSIFTLSALALCPLSRDADRHLSDAAGPVDGEDLARRLADDLRLEPAVGPELAVKPVLVACHIPGHDLFIS